jgi:hypothetical protein
VASCNPIVLTGPDPRVEYTLVPMGTALVITVLVGVALWLWNDSLRARELALRACADTCRRLDVQFLDQTVSLKRLGLGRGDRGVPRVWRLYAFEFSVDGSSRETGHALVRDDEVEYVHLDHPRSGSLFDASPPGVVRRD